MLTERLFERRCLSRRCGRRARRRSSPRRRRVRSSASTGSGSPLRSAPGFRVDRRRDPLVQLLEEARVGVRFRRDRGQRHRAAVSAPHQLQPLVAIRLDHRLDVGRVVVDGALVGESAAAPARAGPGRRVRCPSFSPLEQLAAGVVREVVSDRTPLRRASAVRSRRRRVGQSQRTRRSSLAARRRPRVFRRARPRDRRSGSGFPGSGGRCRRLAVESSLTTTIARFRKSLAQWFRAGQSSQTT